MTDWLELIGWLVCPSSVFIHADEGRTWWSPVDVRCVPPTILWELIRYSVGQNDPSQSHLTNQAVNLLEWRQTQWLKCQSLGSLPFSAPRPITSMHLRDVPIASCISGRTKAPPRKDQVDGRSLIASSSATSCKLQLTLRMQQWLMLWSVGTILPSELACVSRPLQNWPQLIIHSDIKFINCMVY